MSGGHKIGVVVADDSFLMRKLLVDLLHSDPDIKVIGEAKDGVAAVEMVVAKHPDVVLMDYHMPIMDGAAATEKILRGPGPLPAIIIFSAYTREGADATFRCMRAGAVDYILKPSGELSLDLDKVREQIISRIKEVSHATVRRLHPSRVKERKKVRLTGAEPRKVIVIGASTGGPPLIEEILSELPAHYSNVILVAQHMPKFFTQSFAARLNGLTDIFVKEAESGEPIKSGEVLIIPGGIHIKVEQRKVGGGGDVFKLTKDDKEDGIFPSIDLLMSSVAQAYGDRVVGVLLSGMGTDGLEGMRAIKRCGGHTIAQDPKTAVVSSMPGAVIENNLADEILTPKQIAQKIIKLG